MSSEHAYKAISAWEMAQGQEMRAFAEKYRQFVSQCKTERETVAYAREKLEAQGFCDNPSADRFMRVLQGKALFALRRGVKPLDTGLRLIASHGDCPRLDFKQHPFVEQAGVVQAKTHYYGGIKKYQWLARPLALHGVVILESGESVRVTVGEAPTDPVFCIADLLPHLAQKQSGQKVSDAFEGEKLNIILAHEPEPDGEDEAKKTKDPIKARLLDYFFNKYHIREEDFITAELEAVPAGEARFVGFDQSMIGGYGQDDRICVFCSLSAFLEPEQSVNNTAIIIWDKEEIGSDGATGASSRFFQYCVEAAAKSSGVEAADVFLHSQAISADVTAALDPDYQDVHEKHNAALIGNGPCFSKFTGSRGKYGASEAGAEFFAQLRALFNKKRIPWQAAELGKVDLGGGGTVALFLAAYGMNVIDLGPALLSMHSPFELSGVADLYATWKAYQAFLDEDGNDTVPF